MRPRTPKPISPTYINPSPLEFVTDILIDPSTRGVTDIAHAVTAAASSSSADRAQKLLQEMKCPSSAKAYGSYAELAADPNVDVIYVATPHSHHYQNVMLCLEHGKHVLCEKSFTVNAPQTEKLVQVAKEKGLFLMEAVWTRHFPLSMQIRSAIEKGEIGPVYRAFADLSLAKDVEGEFGTEHRMVNMDLAGGALLDCKLLFYHVSAFEFPRESKHRASRGEGELVLPRWQAF